jgi:hypothetical protein
VRAHGVLLETDAGAEHQSQSKRRHAGDDFDDHAACVVQRAKLEQPAARNPHPTGHHRTHRDRPHRDEDHPGGELGTVRDGTADQCSGDDCEASWKVANSNSGTGPRAVPGLMPSIPMCLRLPTSPPALSSENAIV